MWPKLIETSSGALPAYGLLVTLAFAVAILYTHWRVHQIGILPDRMLPAYLLAFGGGLLGARLLHAIAVEPSRFLHNPLVVFNLAEGGFAIYGGLLGGLLAVGGYIVAQHMPFWKMADIIWPGVLVAMGIGRVGCFFAGCCHGVPIHGFSEAGALHFPAGDVLFGGTFPFFAHLYHAGAGHVSRIVDVPLYPTQAWSALVGIGVGGLLMVRWPRRRFDGQMVALGLMLEPPFRILIEGFRSDSRGYVISWPIDDVSAAWLPGMAQAGSSLGTAVMGITTSQFIGVLFFVLGVAIYLVRRGQGVAEQAALPVHSGDDDLLLAADIPE